MLSGDSDPQGWTLKALREAGNSLMSELYGLDEREITDLYATIDRMTLDDARRVIRQYYPLENLVFVVIGKASDIGSVVVKYAPRVDRRSISEAGFEAAPAPGTR